MWKDRTGEKFGRLTILGDAEPYDNGKRLIRRVKCKCDCGNEVEIYLGQLKPWRNSSCGCGRNKFLSSHKMSTSRIYRIWWGMVCRGTGKSARKNYADKGITVCERWLTFENFYEDMGERPFPKASLDRIDNSKGYSPENCRWATWEEQARNKCSNVVLEYEGNQVCLTELANKLGFDVSTLHYRIKKYGIEKAISMPIKRVIVEIQGERLFLKMAVKRVGVVPYDTVLTRMKKGWTVAQALVTPPRQTPISPDASNALLCSGAFSPPPPDQA